LQCRTRGVIIRKISHQIQVTENQNRLYQTFCYGYKPSKNRPIYTHQCKPQAAEYLRRQRALLSTLTKTQSSHMTSLSLGQGSWQGHLQRVSHYLKQGEGQWWKGTDSGYEFHDGDNSSTAPRMPTITHF